MLLILMAPWMVLLTVLLFYRAATGTHQLEDGSSDEEEELFVNTNHPSPPDYSPSDTSSSSGQD